MRSLRFIPILVLLSFLATGCASGIPPTKTAHSKATSFIKKYRHQYPSSIFGSNIISEININRVRQQSRKRAEVQAFIGMDSGQTANVLFTMRNNPPFGWKIISWEMLELH